MPTKVHLVKAMAFPPHSSIGKESACNAGDLGSTPGSGRSLGEGNSNPLQYCHLENPMDREAWQATVHGLQKSQTQLRDYSNNYEAQVPQPIVQRVRFLVHTC